MGNCFSGCADKVCSWLGRAPEVTYIAPPSITLDTNLTGKAVTLSDRNTSLTGEGCSLGGCSLQQDRAYFEFKILKNEGSFQIGVGARRVDKDKPLGDDPSLSWIFQSHPKLAAGDVIVSAALPDSWCRVLWVTGCSL